MSFQKMFACVTFAMVLAGCSSNPPTATSSSAAPAAAPVAAPAPSQTTATPAKPATATAKPAAPAVAKTAPVATAPAAGSKFSKIKIGMQFEQVNDLIGTPNSITRNETGKRWIPFYFGSDVMRMQASYKGEGCLTYTGGNQFGSSGGELITITVDPAGCV